MASPRGASHRRLILSHTFPVDLVVEGLVQRIRSIRADFSPALKVVEVDQYWHVGVEPTKLAARLPAVLVAFEDSSQAVDDFVVMSSWRLKLHYLYHCSGNLRSDLQTSQRLLLESMTQGEQFDEIAELADSIGINHFLSCLVTETRINDSLLAANIGWLEVDVTVRTKSQ